MMFLGNCNCPMSALLCTVKNVSYFDLLKYCDCWFSGLCGTFDGNQTNDFYGSQDNIFGQNQVDQFVQEWK